MKNAKEMREIVRNVEETKKAQAIKDAKDWLNNVCAYKIEGNARRGYTSIIVTYPKQLDRIVLQDLLKTHGYNVEIKDNYYLKINWNE